MGGDRETFLESAEKAKSAMGPADDAGGVAGTMGSVGSASGARIRIHESQGEVHFHDDTAKLKVAVPVSKWFKIWDRLSNEPQRVEIPDEKNKTALTVETKLDNGVLDAVLSIVPMTVGTNFSELTKFTTRR
jgi:hypothetical protein